MATDENKSTNPSQGPAGTAKTGSGNKNTDNTGRKEGVKKGALVTALISLIVLVIAGILVHTHFRNEQDRLQGIMDHQKDSLTKKVIARDSEINEWMMTFDEIEKNIASIKEKEKIISSTSNAELSKDKRQMVLDDIKYINTLLEQNKKKIASLTAQLQKSGGTIKAMQTKIAELEASVKQNENEIADLKTTLVTKNFEIVQLNTQMTVLQDSISQKNEKINSQISVMNKAFYAVGTYKDLNAAGVLIKKGGFLGLGKKESLAANFSDTAFVQIDVTVTKSIPVNAKSAVLISSHPSGSYELVTDKDKKIVSLEIKDPALFWKISKYAVVDVVK
jgi:flagellar biosynthesis chaperone FliJ